MGGYDLFTTPGGGTTSVNLSGTPLAFLGDITLKGVPFLAGSDTDTIIARGDPTPNPIPADMTGSFPIEVVALHLVSASPVDIDPGTMVLLVGLHATINVLGLPALPTNSPGLPNSTGTLTILSHDDVAGGGTFSAFFDVFADITLTAPGGDPRNAGDVLAPTSVFQDTFRAEGCWSHTPGPNDAHSATFPAGGFYPGVDSQACPGNTHRYIPEPGKVWTDELAALARHGVIPAQTPEPATLLLFGSGLVEVIGLGLRRKQIQKRLLQKASRTKG